MCGHAGTVGTLRPLRRPSPHERWARAGRRPGEVARPTRCRSPGRPDRRVPDGPPGLARTAAARRPARDIRITPKAARRLDEAAARIYRTGRITWDGRFDLSSWRPPTARRDRQRLAANLGFLGYGTLDEHTWVATRAGEDVDVLLEEAGVRYERFTAAHAAGTPGAMGVVRRAWDLDEIGHAYERFVAEQRAGWPAVTGAAATRRRTRPGSGWCTRGVRSSSRTRSSLRRCCPKRWPGTARRQLLRPARRPAPAGRRPVRRAVPRRR